MHLLFPIQILYYTLWSTNIASVLLARDLVTKLSDMGMTRLYLLNTTTKNKLKTFSKLCYSSESSALEATIPSISLLQSFFLITPFYSLLMLAVYLLGEVDVVISIPLIFSFAPYLPFASLTFLWT